MLVLLILLPILGAILAAVAGRTHPNGAKVAALISGFASLQVSYLVASSASSMPLAIKYDWVPDFGITFDLVCDWASAVLILLTSFLVLVAIAISWTDIRERIAGFYVWLLLLQSAITLVFMARDMVLFYIGWELMLVPTLFLIGGYGTGRRDFAAIKFVLFTFAGSVFLLASLLYIYFAHAAQTGVYSFNLSTLVHTKLSSVEQQWVFFGLLLGFGVKAPLIPLHSWLADAYPSAPPSATILLSGIMSKTAVFGLWKIAYPLAPAAAMLWQPYLITAAVVGVIYGALVAFQQIDIKRLIAFSSLSHVGFILAGLFLGSAQGIAGAYLQMICHGLTTAGLFFIAGAIEQRVRNRDIDMLGGLWQSMPVLGGFLLFFSFASLGLPGTGNFVGELYIITAAFEYRWWLGALLAFGVFLAAIYTLKLFTAVMHGQPASSSDLTVLDADRRENLVLGVVATALIVIGFFPALITAPLRLSYEKPVPMTPGVVRQAAPSATSTGVLNPSAATGAAVQ